jgi:membrane-bound metal-dependent hydrolase YbcI (DUF457 family)
VTIAATAHGVSFTPQSWLLGALLTTGGALLPDIDHPPSTVARTFGFATRLLAKIVNRFSEGVYTVTKTKQDSHRDGGHRTFTHTLVFAALAGFGTTALLRTGYWQVLAAFLFVFSGLALRGLLHTWDHGQDGLAVTVAAAALTALLWQLLKDQSGQSFWAGIAVGVGCVAHCLGDTITERGCPMFWPLPLGSRTWYPVAPPKAMRMRTGGHVELKLTLPLLMLVALWLSMASLQRIGALPWLHGLHLLPTGTSTA